MDKTRIKAITYSLRSLLEDIDLQGVAKELYQKRNSEKEVSIFLPLANDCADKIASGVATNIGSSDLKDCWNLKDTMLLGELEKFKVLAVKLITEGDDSAGRTIGFVAIVKINNQSFLEYLNGWVDDLSYITNYGIFSLHAFSGEAYCLDHKYIFHTNKGLFRVFLAFLKEPTHTLSFKRIFQEFTANLDVCSANDQETGKVSYSSESIHQIIGEIREKLLMKGKLSKLFLISGDTYLLKTL